LEILEWRRNLITRPGPGGVDEEPGQVALRRGGKVVGRSGETKEFYCAGHRKFSGGY